MKMDASVVAEIRKMLDVNPCGMLEFYDGRVFFILKHWQYQDINSAPRISLCRSEKPTDVHLIRGKYLYIQGHEHLTELLNNEGKQKTKRSAY